MLKYIFSPIWVVTMIGTVSAWWDEGHLIIGRIAFDILNESNPEVIRNVNSVLEYLKEDGSYSTFTHSEDKYPLVECAVFADQVKKEGAGGEY